MLRGFYTAASGMLTQQRKTEMLANNMAKFIHLVLKRISHPFVRFQRCCLGGLIKMKTGIGTTTKNNW